VAYGHCSSLEYRGPDEGSSPGAWKGRPRHDRRRAYPDNDLIINILPGQAFHQHPTTRRIGVRLTPPIQMTLEKALAYIED